MALTIVGTPECSISTVVSLVVAAEGFSLLLKKLGDFGRGLDTNRELLKKLRRDIDLDKISLSDVLDQLVEEWVARTDDKATVVELVRVLEVNGLKSLASPLRKEFIKDAVPPPTRIPSNEEFSTEEITEKFSTLATSTSPKSDSGDKRINEELKTSAAPANFGRDVNTNSKSLPNELADSDDDAVSSSKTKTPYPSEGATAANTTTQFSYPSVFSDSNELVSMQNLPQYLLAKSKARSTVKTSLDSTPVKIVRKYGKDNLFSAIHKQNETAVIDILKNVTVDIINAQGEDLETALHLAAACFADQTVGFRMIKCLIEKGADPFAKDSDDHVFLHWFFLSDTQMTSSLLHQISEYLVCKELCSLFSVPGSDDGLTPLHMAIADVEDIQKRTLALLRYNGVNFNMTDSKGTPLLKFAVDEKLNANTLAALIEYGAYPHFMDIYGRTLLHCAVSGLTVDRLPIINVLVGAGLKINQVDTMGISVLGGAIEQRVSTNCLHYLVQLGADWTIINSRGNGVLHIAAKYGTIHTLQFFLSLGNLDVNRAGSDGNTAMHFAVLSAETVDVVQKIKILVQCGAYPYTLKFSD